MAQEVLQLRRMPQTPRFGPGLRRPRQGDPLQGLLFETVRPERIRLRPRPHPSMRRRCRPGRPQSGPEFRSESRPRTGVLPMRLRRVRRRTDDQQEPRLAQALLQLRRLQQILRFDEFERRPER